MRTPCLIIANHNTDIDPVLVGMGFARHMYFVASEHILRMDFGSKLLKNIFSPIIINKTEPDASAAREILRRLNAGYNVCLFAEGNRSYSGLTGKIPASTAKLIKFSRAELFTFKLEGGYFTTPRWSAKGNKRKGKMLGTVMGHYPAAELKAMTDAQILDIVERDIYVDAYESQRELETPIRYRGKNLAEHIEVALYLCPNCKKIGTIRSLGNGFSCPCGLNAVYTETGFIKGSADGTIPFTTITDWDKWQSEYLAEIVASTPAATPICRDENQKLYRVVDAHERSLVGQGLMQITLEEFECAGEKFSLEEITRFAIVDQMTLLFALKGGTQYEVRSDAPRSVSKYQEILRILRM